MTIDDVPRVADIEEQAFSDAWPASAFRDLLGRAYARLRVAQDASATVQGYCVLLRAADEGEIANICTAPEVRGRGVGGRLLDDALAAAELRHGHAHGLRVAALFRHGLTAGALELLDDHLSARVHVLGAVYEREGSLGGSLAEQQQAVLGCQTDEESSLRSAKVAFDLSAAS
jgi:ribosomal protein S18 acetylase RimI-like enzyme